jgi:ketosteroid isomerase-like protein
MNNTTIRIILVIIIFASLVNCRNGQNAYYQNLQGLIEAERAFARLSGESGMRSAFTTWLADEAIVFRPQPVKGKERYANSPDIPGMLIWQPLFADVSTAGDLGYTSGPYEFRREGEGHPVDGYGHYVSIWKKQAASSWKVIIDVGISHPTPNLRLQDTVLVVSNPKMIKFNVSFPDTSALLQLDNAFSDSATTAGYRQALENFASSAIRIYRENYFPFLGTTGIDKEVDGPTMWRPISAGIASSGDLGYTYGIASGGSEGLESEKGSYLRIWKIQADGSWKLVLEITNPMSD